MIAFVVPLLSSIGGLVVLLVGVVLILRHLRARGRAEMDREVLKGRAPKRIDESANFFGIESRSAVQLRGNGCLALTDDELVFIMWVPRRTVRIALAEIVLVDEAKSHLGKTIARKLLRVRWRTAGVEDTVAWYVKDLAGWLAELRSATTARPHV